MTDATLSFEEMWEKILACDSTYDGVFYTAVKTTRIYCRPSCRSRKPKQQNVVFYRNRMDAEDAGFRPCKRCQPDLERTPQADLVARAMTFLIEHHDQKVLLQDVADHVGVSPFYLERLFKQHASVTPREYLEIVRVDKAAHLLATTDRTNLEISYEVGFQSPSLYYKAFRSRKQCSPGNFWNLVRE